jgi:hypothetical protein
VEETGVNPRPAVSHCQALSHNVVLISEMFTRTTESDIIIGDLNFHGFLWINWFSICIVPYILRQVWVGYEVATLVVIGTNYIGNCKSNYHTIRTTTQKQNKINNKFKKTTIWLSDILSENIKSKNSTIFAFHITLTCVMHLSKKCTSVIFIDWPLIRLC